MFIKPEKIVFETPHDVIDYVSKGMVPTRKNFEKVMIKVRTPDTNADALDNGRLYIPDHVFMNCDNDVLEDALRRVYENRVRNRNITLGIIGAMALGLLLGGVVKGNDKDKDEEPTVLVVDTNGDVM